MRASRHLLLRDDSPAPPTTLLRDTFARANSAVALGTCDTGQVWSALTGTWGVDTNMGYRPGITATDCVASIDVGASWLSYEVVVFANPEFPGVAFDITDSNNFYAVLVNNSLRRLELYKRVSGTYTSIGVSASTIFTAFADLTIKVVRSGSSKAIQLAGTPVISLTDSSLSVTNKVGFRLQTGLGTNTSRWKNITVMSP